MSMRQNLVFTSERRRPSEVLVIAPLHPFPARSGSAVRIAQYVRHIGEQGLGVDLAVLSDGPSLGRDVEAAQAAIRFCHRVVVVRHPIASSAVARFSYRAWGRLAGFRLGDWLHCPPRLSRAVRRHFAFRPYRAVIVSGVHLARLSSLFRSPTLRILETQDVWYDRYQSYAALGRAAELGNFADPRREARLVERFHAVLAISARDAAIFRELGVRCPIHVVPFAADAQLLGTDGADGEGNGSLEAEPARPPRILFVGTETSSNLDAIRFFRHRVFPAVRRQAPTCRLRVVGLSAHHLEPGPGVELVGWVDHLASEYRAAAAVVVPLRMGSGLKTKVVEALAHGKALLTTLVGAQGIDLQPGRDAVVSDDPAVLAREAVRILTDDAARLAYEANARALASQLFDPEVAFRPLRELLGLEPRVAPPAPRAVGALLV